MLPVLFRLFVCFITYCRWGQSTSYNVAHPACGLKGSTISPRFTHTNFYRDAGSAFFLIIFSVILIYFIFLNSFPCPADHEPGCFLFFSMVGARSVNVYPLHHGGSPCLSTSLNVLHHPCLCCVTTNALTRRNQVSFSQHFMTCENILQSAWRIFRLWLNSTMGLNLPGGST